MANPMASHLVNATGTLEILEAARRARKPQVVVASSSSVYGANPKLPKREDNVAMPASPYTASKLAAESYTLAYGRCFDLPVLAFRFFNVSDRCSPRTMNTPPWSPRSLIRLSGKRRYPFTATEVKVVISPSSTA